MKYRGTFVSYVADKLLQDRERYRVLVEIDPWNKLVSSSCECKGFMYGKGRILCKHISNDDKENPGILQILKKWGEIEEIPQVEE